MGEKILGWVLDIVKNMIYDLFILPLLVLFEKLEYLVFGIDLKFLTFTEAEWNLVVLRGLSITSQIMGFIILIGVFYFSMKLPKAGINPQTRSEIIHTLGAFLFVGFVVNNLTTIIELIFTINSLVIEFFKIDIQRITNIDNIDFAEEDGLIAYLFIMFVKLGITIWVNIYYIMRKFTLILLIILGPIFVCMYIFQFARGIVGTWFREILSNVFVQSIHVALIWTYLQLQFTGDGSLKDSIQRLILLATFIPIAEGLKTIIGLNPSMTGRASMFATMMGGAALVAFTSAAKNAVGQDGLIDNLKYKYGFSQKERIGNNGYGYRQIGQDTMDSHAPLSARTQRMLKVGNITRNAGRAFGTLAGAAMFSPFGAGGVMAGAVAGNTAGGGIGRMGGTAAYASVSVLSDKASAMKSNIQEELSKVENERNYEYGGNIDTPEANLRRMVGNVVQVADKAKAVGRGVMKPTTANLSEFEIREKQIERNAIAGAIIGGQDMAQKMADRAMNNLGSHSKGLEYSQLLAKLGRNKNLKLVVTNEESYMAATMKNPLTGIWEEVRVTESRKGDPTLAPGQAVFKDYHVSKGRIVEGRQGEAQRKGKNHQPFTDFYTFDSNGKRVKVNNSYNVNPYGYFENKDNNHNERYFSDNRFRQGIF